MNWKRRERQAARIFRCKRRPLSGSADTTDCDDIQHPQIFGEVKLRKRHSTWSLFRDVRQKAKKAGKRPVIFLAEHNMAGLLVVIHSDDLPYVLECLTSDSTLDRLQNGNDTKCSGLPAKAARSAKRERK